MPMKMEPVHTGEFLVSEGNNSISREVVTLAADLDLAAGTVLGKTAANVYTQLDPSASDGTEVAIAVLYAAHTTDAAGGKAVIIARLAEVVDSLLVFAEAVTDEQKATALDQLAMKDIIARS